jgi:hypothetical protein
VNFQAEPFHIKEYASPALMVVPNNVNEALPMWLIYMTRPAAVSVGDGIVRVWPAVVWLMVKEVATSTVAAAVPMLPPLAKSLMAIEVYLVLLAFVKVEPVASVKPALILALPVTCKVAPLLLGAAPMPILVLIVSATNRLLVPAASWIWNAVVVFWLFWKSVWPLIVPLNCKDPSRYAVAELVCSSCIPSTYHVRLVLSDCRINT